jgi:hypothetical protein
MATNLPYVLRMGSLQQPFRFLDLPAELRIRVYELLLDVEATIDLDPANQRQISPLLSIFSVSRQLHEEAFRVFYGKNTFRIFSTNGKFYHTKHHLLSRLSPSYRAAITTMELRLGPGWSAPPKRWIVNNKLGLSDCKALRQLKVFVEIDPSCHEIFRDFRLPHDLYTRFCTSLLQKILARVPSIVEIQFDGYPSVKKNGQLMSALFTEAMAVEKVITFGPERGWSDDKNSSSEFEESKDLEKISVTRGLTEDFAVSSIPVTLVQA